MSLPETQDKRLHELLRNTLIAVLAGIAYAILVYATGFGIPCLFFKVTGFKCPGCGITRMFVSLLKFDIIGAWNANQALTLLLLPSVLFALYAMKSYVKYGRAKLTEIHNYILYSVCIALVLFGIVRNF